jgi:hypothetical protein
MRGGSDLSGKADAKAVSIRPIVLSRWVNEPYPPLTELLSAHDVARLTRRPRWLLAGLALIGRFPKEARFRGRALGWWRSDVLEWMAKDCLRITTCRRSRVGEGSLGKRAHRWSPAAASSSERTRLLRSTSVRNRPALLSASPTRGQVIEFRRSRSLRYGDSRAARGLLGHRLEAWNDLAFSQSVKFTDHARITSKRGPTRTAH